LTQKDKTDMILGFSSVCLRQAWLGEGPKVWLQAVAAVVQFSGNTIVHRSSFAGLLAD
jgi:hypothetical protein